MASPGTGTVPTASVHIRSLCRHHAAVVVKNRKEGACAGNVPMLWAGVAAEVQVRQGGGGVQRGEQVGAGAAAQNAVLMLELLVLHAQLLYLLPQVFDLGAYGQHQVLLHEVLRAQTHRLTQSPHVRWQRATARIRPPPLQQSISISCLPGPQQQTCSSEFAALGMCGDRQADGTVTNTFKTLFHILCQQLTSTSDLIFKSRWNFC